ARRLDVSILIDSSDNARASGRLYRSLWAVPERQRIPQRGHRHDLMLVVPADQVRKHPMNARSALGRWYRRDEAARYTFLAGIPGPRSAETGGTPLDESTKHDSGGRRRRAAA